MVKVIDYVDLLNQDLKPLGISVKLNQTNKKYTLSLIHNDIGKSILTTNELTKKEVISSLCAISWLIYAIWFNSMLGKNVIKIPKKWLNEKTIVK
jgi:hypothetical protein